MSAYEYWFCDTVTGVKQLRVVPSSGAWSRVLNGAGSGSHTFQLGDRKLPRSSWRSLTSPWARTLVVARGGKVVYAGLVKSLQWDAATKTLTVNHADVRTILGDRYPFGVTSYHGGTLVVTGKSFGAAAAMVVGAGLIGPRPIFALPIVLPSTATSGTYSHTYNAYNFTTVADALTDIQKLGPDIDFEPRWSSSDTLEWVMRVGANLLTGGAFDFPMNAGKPALTGVKNMLDASQQVTGVYAIGQGSGEDMIVGGIPAGTEQAAIIPARETTQPYKESKTEAEASGYAVAATNALHEATSQWSFSYIINDDIAPVENLQLGSTLRLYYDDDEWIYDGWQTVRLTGLSGDMTETVTPTVQGV